MVNKPAIKDNISSATITEFRIRVENAFKTIIHTAASEFDVLALIDLFTYLELLCHDCRSLLASKLKIKQGRHHADTR